MALTFDLKAANDDDVVAVFPSMAAARSYLERTAEWALDLLDQVTGDIDLEDGSDDEPGGDDEPALGWSGVAQLRLTAQEDGETSLGWANEGNQARLHATAMDDAEPSLGSLGGTAAGCAWGQGQWSGGNRDDREQDAGDEPEAVNEDGCDMGGSDNGIADSDALQEIYGL